MKTRVLLTTLISFLLLCAVVAAGLNAIFTVTAVEADFSVVSAEGEREAAELRQKLDGFVGKSSAFLDEEEVASVIAAYPCMRADKIEKRYPFTLEVEISEREEMFSILSERGYAVIAGDGTFLYYKDDLTNRTDGENILLTGFDLTLTEGEGVEDETFSTLLAAYSVFEEVLLEARANIVSIAYDPNPVFDTFVVQMREGVRIEIVSPTEGTEEKVRAALLDEGEGYLACSDGEKLCGCITVVGGESGIEVDYDATRN